MIRLPSADFAAGFLCDEIRKEDNGKLLAFGIYSSNITLGEFPVELGVTLAFRMKAKKLGTTNFKIRALFNGEELMQIHATLDVLISRWDLSPTPRFGIKLSEPGELEFQVCEADSGWKSLMTLPVELAKVS